MMSLSVGAKTQDEKLISRYNDVREYNSQEDDIYLIGQGGNTKVYLLSREYNCYSSAVIKEPMGFKETRVKDTIKYYQLLKVNGIKTTAFLDECRLNGEVAIITENLHQTGYTYIDANPHLEREQDKLLAQLGEVIGIRHPQPKEPEEERKFADRKFKEVTNIINFAKSYINTLGQVSSAHIYMENDCYFFRVKDAEITDIDYIIADWDNIYDYYEPDLFEKNKEEFKTALRQFLMWYVVEDKAEEYEKVIMGL